MITNQTTPKESHQTTAVENREYEMVRAKIEQNIRACAATKTLFRTDATNLFDTFLSALPANRRQHYNCNACRKFFNDYCSLVTIEDGIAHPIAFDAHLDYGFFNEAVRRCIRAIKTTKVAGPLLFTNSTWGTPQSNGWSHFSAQHVPTNYHGVALDADQKMAEKREDFRILAEDLGGSNSILFAVQLRR